MAQRILLINGPNLNLLGTREPGIYGADTLVDIEQRAKDQAKAAGATVQTFQSNHEGAILDAIHKARDDKVDVIIINAGAYTHTSVAISDALAGVNIKYIEVHISNVHAREPFRHHSYLSNNAWGIIVGLGTYGYTAAIDHALKNFKP